MKQIKELKSLGYKIKLAKDLSWVFVSGSDLDGNGWTDANGMPVSEFSTLIGLPPDFPMTYPGSTHGNPRHSVHIPLIYYNGQSLSSLHRCSHEPWRWLCFKNINWDSQHDGLITIMQIVETTVYRRRR